MFMALATGSKSNEYDRFFRKLGQRVRELRYEKGMVQEDMLEYGFSTRHYQRIEAGLPINVITALRICKVFKISLSDLFKGL